MSVRVEGLVLRAFEVKELRVEGVASRGRNNMKG